jgi:hypothetical protein
MMLKRVGLRPGVKYRTRAEFFARSETFHTLTEYEWVKPLRLDLEPGSVGIFERANGEVIVVRYEDDIRDEWSGSDGDGQV